MREVYILKILKNVLIKKIKYISEIIQLLSVKLYVVHKTKFVK